MVQGHLPRFLEEVNVYRKEMHEKLNIPIHVPTLLDFRGTFDMELGR